MAYTKLITLFILNYLHVTPIAAIEPCPYNISGLIAPVFTGFDDNGTLNLDIIPQFAQYLIDNDIYNIAVASYLGEGPKLSVAEVKRLLSAWLEVATPLNIKVIVFIGGRPFKDVLDLASYAEKVRVDAISTTADLFYKPDTPEDLVDAIERIAQAAPNTPLIYYDDPDTTEVSVDIVQFTKQATERISTFKAIAVTDCDDILRVLPLLQADQQIIVANATFLRPTVFLGVRSFGFAEVILFPNTVKELIRIGEQGRLDEAQNIDANFITQSRIILSQGSPVPAYKVAMNLLTGIDVGPPRAPEPPLTEDEQINIEQQLKDQGVVIKSPIF